MAWANQATHTEGVACSTHLRGLGALAKVALHHLGRQLPYLLHAGEARLLQRVEPVDEPRLALPALLGGAAGRNN